MAISDLLKLDLPGSEYTLFPEDANNVMRTQFARLWGLTSYGRSRTLVNMIEMQAIYFPQVCALEYQLNEIQYEIRKALKYSSVDHETQVVTRWVQAVIDASDADTGIEFYQQLMKKRADRC